VHHGAAQDFGPGRINGDLIIGDFRPVPAGYLVAVIHDIMFAFPAVPEKHV